MAPGHATDIMAKVKTLPRRYPFPTGGGVFFAIEEIPRGRADSKTSCPCDGSDQAALRSPPTKPAPAAFLESWRDRRLISRQRLTSAGANRLEANAQDPWTS